MDDMDFEELAKDQQELDELHRQELRIKERIEKYQNDERFQRVQAVKKQVNSLIDEGVLTKEQLAKILGVEIKTKRVVKEKYFLNPVDNDDVVKSGNLGVTVLGRAIKSELEAKGVKDYNVQNLMCDADGKAENPEEYKKIKDFFAKNKASADAVKKGYWH